EPMNEHDRSVARGVGRLDLSTLPLRNCRHPELLHARSCTLDLPELVLSWSEDLTTRRRSHRPGRQCESPVLLHAGRWINLISSGAVLSVSRTQATVDPKGRRGRA